MKAILTKFLGPTNARGARVKAYDSDGNTAIVPFDDAGDPHDNAVLSLCNHLNWGRGTLVRGAVKLGFAYVWTAEAGGHELEVK